jgi:hypothetical protein
MIINNEEAAARLNSPMNLINRLRRESGSSKKNDSMSLFGMPPRSVKEDKKNLINPFARREAPPEKIDILEEPAKLEKLEKISIDNILENSDSQIKLGLAHDEALKLLNSSISLLATKLDDVRADKLPSVISAASKTVESIRKERAEATKNGKDREVHYHFYTPEQRKLTDYEVIDVGFTGGSSASNAN